jgi:hypothetical protein
MKIFFAAAVMLLTSACMTSYTTRGGNTFAVGAAPAAPYYAPPVYRPRPWWRRGPVWRRGPYRAVHRGYRR